MKKMELIKNAEIFAKRKHKGQFRKDGVTPYSKHLGDVISELKVIYMCRMAS